MTFGNFIIVLLIFLASWVGWMLKALTRTGALAAVLTGLAIFAGSGGEGLILLGAFFVSSSLWSKFKSINKESIEEKLAKGSRRDWRQVAANGGPAALCGCVMLVNGDPLWILAFSTAIASANSDTWASEIGSLSKREPISLLTLRRAERGTSGAVSLPGTLAALAGAGLIAVLSVYLFNLSRYEGVIIFTFGFAGNLLDTILGAYFQVLYKCHECGLETEKSIHCGKKTAKIKGMAALDNDLVNFLSGILAVLGIVSLQFI